MNCKYCDREFSKSSNLDKHLRTAKYCRKIQEEHDKELICTYCGRLFSRSDSVLRHRTTCLEYLVHIKTIELETEIKYLQERLTEKTIELDKKDKQIQELTNMAINKPNLSVVNIGMSDRVSSYPQQFMSTQPVEDLHRMEQVTKLTNMISELYKEIMNLSSIYRTQKLLTNGRVDQQD